MIELITYLIGSGVYAAVVDPLTIGALAMSLIGGAASLAGSAGLNKQRQSNLDAQKSESNAFFNKEYYTDELSRTENQSALRTLEEKLKDSRKRNAATNAITGATPEVAVAQQGNEARAYAEVVNRLAGMASQRKSIIANQWRADKRALYGMQDSIDQGKAATWANLGTNAAQLGGNAIMGMAANKDLAKAGTGGIV